MGPAAHPAAHKANGAGAARLTFPRVIPAL